MAREKIHTDTHRKIHTEKENTHGMHTGREKYTRNTHGMHTECTRQNAHGNENAHGQNAHDNNKNAHGNAHGNPA